MSAVCIVGLGPWGLCALERLVDAARDAPGARLEVHVVEPGRPGGGIFSLDHPDYMVLNTPCGQHSMYPYPPAPGEHRLGTGLYEWAVARGYRWQAAGGGGAQDGALTLEGTGGRAGDALAPGDFLPRRLMGEYLEWFFEVLKREAPPGMTIVHHRSLAVDIEPAPGGRERVHLDNGGVLEVDHVALTTGHMQEGTSVGPHRPGAPAGRAGAGGRSEHFTVAYPVEGYLGSVSPAQSVAIEGMGLVALDVLTALTVGLGGRYTAAPGGRLRYHASGREPRIYMFSRGGFPYCAKSFGAADPVGDYVPAICTMEAVRALKTDSAGRPRRMDARAELLPLVFAEMDLCHYVTAAAERDGAGAADAVRSDLLRAWSTGSFGAARTRWASEYGAFSAAEHFFLGEGARYRTAADYQAALQRYVAADLDAALVEGGTSPAKAALETLRALRDTLRYAVEFKGLEFASHLDFQDNLRGRFARLVAGPPAFRNQQLLALVEAGVLHMPFGPSPRVELLAGGRTLVCSTRLDEPVQVEVDRVVRAHLELPAIGRSASPLLANLVRRGRARALDFEGRPAGSIDVDVQFHPVGSSGEVQRRLWVFGVLTEGARYFTLYVPSPKSRARAFVDAEVFAETVLAGTSPTGVVPGRHPAVARPVPARAQDEVIVLTDAPGRKARLRPGERRPLRVALVNNMPDPAFVDTEEQWLGLLGARRSPGGGQSEVGGQGEDVEVKFFTLPGVDRSPRVEAVVAERYRPLTELWDEPPDMLLLTGAEPKTPELTEEAYWPAMERLLWWSRSAVPHVVASCLSAHAALWAFDHLPRQLLLDKCSGVYEQEVLEGHPLTRGVSGLSLAHSRFNEVPERDLRNAGYEVVLRGDGCGWSVATARRGQCRLLLFQGHPEYGRLTLLREYRRDVRRYLLGTQGSYPNVPPGYLTPAAEVALARYRRRVTDGRYSTTTLSRFPYEEAAAGIRADWAEPSRRIMANWVATALAARDGAAASGRDAAGPDGAGPDGAGPDRAGSDRAGSDRATFDLTTPAPAPGSARLVPGQAVVE